MFWNETEVKVHKMAALRMNLSLFRAEVLLVRLTGRWSDGWRVVWDICDGDGGISFETMDLMPD